MGESHWAHLGLASSGPIRSLEQGSAASRAASKVSGANPIRNDRAKAICSAEVAASRSMRSCGPLTGTGCTTKSRGLMIDLMVIPPVDVDGWSRVAVVLPHRGDPPAFAGYINNRRRMSV
jgi:hypothetical protein